VQAVPVAKAKYIGPSRGAFGGAGARWAQDDKSGVGMSVTDELFGGGKLWYCRILEFVTEYGMPSELQVGSSNERVPPLRIAIGEANRNAPVGMTVL
jgi:hypothetical protein